MVEYSKRKKADWKKNVFLFIIWLYVVAAKAYEWRKRLGRHEKQREYEYFSLTPSLFLLQRSVLKWVCYVYLLHGNGKTSREYQGNRKMAFPCCSSIDAYANLMKFQPSNSCFEQIIWSIINVMCGILLYQRNCPKKKFIEFGTHNLFDVVFRLFIWAFSNILYPAWHMC